MFVWFACCCGHLRPPRDLGRLLVNPSLGGVRGNEGTFHTLVINGFFFLLLEITEKGNGWNSFRRGMFNLCRSGGEIIKSEKKNSGKRDGDESETTKERKFP